MKQIDVELKKGDRVWVQEYDCFGDPLRLRFAEVLGVVNISGEAVPRIAIHYLDGSRKHECISPERIKEYCRKEEY